MSTHDHSFERWLRNEVLNVRGWTMTDFIRRSGISRGTVYKWFQGRRPEPENCHRIAQTLSISDDLYVDPNYVMYVAHRPPEDESFYLSSSKDTGDDPEEDSGRRRLEEAMADYLYSGVVPSTELDRLTPHQRETLSQIVQLVVQLANREEE